MITIQETVQVEVDGEFISVNDLIEENQNLKLDRRRLIDSYNALRSDIVKIYTAISKPEVQMDVAVTEIMELMNDER